MTEDPPPKDESPTKLPSLEDLPKVSANDPDSISGIEVRAARGAAWLISSSIGTRLIGLVGTLVLTKFIAPDSYGEVAAASILLLSANQLTTLGIGQYVIAKPDASRAIVFHATFIHVALGILAIGGCLLLRNWLGILFDAPRLTQYIGGLALANMIERVRFMPERIIIRDMRFRDMSSLRTAGEIAYSSVSVACAWAGLGAMSIVWGNIARAIARSLFTFPTTDLRDWFEPCRLRMKEFRALLDFGLPLWVGAGASFASRNWDNLLVSRFFGPGVMGEYQLAYNFADIPAVQVGEQIGDVLLPSFAQMTPPERNAALVRSTTLLGLIMFPLAIGLGAVAPTAVNAFLDRRWAGVAPMLVILSALSITRPIGWTIESYLQACNRPRSTMILGIFKVFALLASIVAIGRNGPLWTCGAVGVAFALHALLSVLVVRLADGISIGKFFRGLLGPLLACAPMVLAVIGVHRGLQAIGFDRPKLSFVVEIIGGAVAYAAAVMVLGRKSASELIELVKESRKK